MKKHIHIIGICGVAMAPLAVLYKNMGWQVTGSDRAFFPPMSTYLKENGIKIMPGFKKERLSPVPDLVLAMAFITEKNPEVAEAKKRGLPVRSYADVLPDLIERENSIVVSGDCGKTSTASLMAWVLECAGYKPSFMVGGIPKNFGHGIQKTNSNWSVIEGDEYPVASWDNTPRFLFYKPKYLVLTDASWDHMDKFKTEEKYINIFEKLVQNVPEEGAIIANKKGKNISRIVKKAKAPVIFYEERDALSFYFPFAGDIWRQNSAAVVVLLRHIGVSDVDIRRAFKSFSGIKRRQELRAKKENFVIIDDNAHTPIKVSGALQAVSEEFPKHSIYAIYEPGNRSHAALRDEGYKKCFRRAKNIVLPRVSSAIAEKQNFNKRLAGRIKKYYKNCRYTENDREIISDIEKMAVEAKLKKQKVAFVFMSQKGFRGMIEEAIFLLQ